MSSANMPGFTAEASLRKTNAHYRVVRRGTVAQSNQAIVPQFSMKAFVCAAVTAAVLAGQEELIPVMIRVCAEAA